MQDHNIVLLNKNKSVKIINKESEITNHEPEFILIPMMEYATDTFIMVKPKKKLLNFTNSQVSVTLQLISYQEEDSDIIELFTLNKSFSSIVELINFIHSIDRIDYVNYIINSDYYCEFEIIDIKSISITLYKNDKTIYEYKFDNIAKSSYSSNCMVVTLALKDIYELGNTYIGTGNFLNIRNNKWNISEKPDTNSIIGLNLVITQSIYFIDYDIFKLFKNKELSYEFYVFNIDDSLANNTSYNKLTVRENIENDVYEIYFNKSSTQRDTILIIEFLIYIKLIYTIIIMKYNSVLYQVDLNTEKGYDMYLEMKLKDKLHKDEIYIDLLKDKIPSFNNIVEKIYNKWEK